MRVTLRTPVGVLSAFVLVVLGCHASSFGFANENGCQTCSGGCRNGLVTMCLILDPPGCGAQSSTEFCPYGCNVDAPAGCNFYPVDGGTSSGCAASAATIQKGALAGPGARVAVTSFSSTEARVVVATSASAACASESDGGATVVTGSGAVLTLSMPANFAGQVAIGAGASARLTVWANGALTIADQQATAGSVSLTLSQPGGGTMGSYSFTFAADEESGTFVAPTCQICSAGR
jgi:hypothetical protein